MDPIQRSLDEMTWHDDKRCTKRCTQGSARHLWVALLSLLLCVACYSPLPSEEHVCRQCTERCPAGLDCHDGRCVSPGDTAQCDPNVEIYNVCVGRPTNFTSGAGENLVVISSTLPDGLEFDPTSGTISGTPRHERQGAVSVRSGGLGSPETRLEIQATIECVDLTTARFEWCAGKNETAVLQATDDADYRWHTSPLPPGVSQDGPILSGNVATPGTHRVTITLFEGEIVRGRAEIDIVVTACETSSEQPDAGEEGGGPVSLHIETSDLGQTCAGQSYRSAPLAVSGGAGGYEWSLEGSPEGYSIDTSSGVVSSASPASGSVALNVRVRDASNATASAQVTLNVLSADETACTQAPAPRITTTALNPACVDAPYQSVPLVAAGGTGSYAWTIREGPDWLSIDAAGSRLVGTPVVDGAVNVSIAVEDTSGGSAEATLTLLVRAATHQACARTPIEVTTTELRDACIGEPYVETLTATGGDGSYEWLLRSGLPPGLTLDPGGTIRGTIPSEAAPGVYQVDFVAGGVTNSGAVKVLPLRVRSCGALVFIGEDSGTSRLLVTRPPYTAARELSEALLGPGESVISFRASSATSKLAFIVSNPAPSSPARLYTADASTLDVQALEWPASIGATPSILDYVWSLDGSYVGVVASTPQQTLLGVVSGETGELTSSTTIGSYQGKLFAVEQKLCYVVAGAREESDVLCNEVVALELSSTSRREGGFIRGSQIASGQFLAGDESYLAILGPSVPIPQGQFHSFRVDFIYPSIDHVFSSTLSLAAGLNFDGDQLELIRLEPDPEFGDPIVVAPLPDCEAVLAWSQSERTLVCQGSADVRVFELATDGSVQRSFGIAQSEGHLIGEARRVISPDGRWFAYDEGSALHLVDLSAPVPTSVLVHEQNGSSLYSGLALDSAGRQLFYHHGSALYALAFETGAVLPLNGSVLLAAPPSCRLSYLAAPDLWCGTDVIPSTFFPSPAGDEVAFLSTSRQLHVANLERLPDGPRQVTALPVNCSRPDGELRCNEHVAWVHR